MRAVFRRYGAKAAPPVRTLRRCLSKVFRRALCSAVTKSAGQSKKALRVSFFFLPREAPSYAGLAVAICGLLPESRSFLLRKRWNAMGFSAGVWLFVLARTAIERADEVGFSRPILGSRNRETLVANAGLGAAFPVASMRSYEYVWR